MRRVGRSGLLVLRRVRRGMLMVLVAGMMRVRVMQACSARL